MKINTEQKDTLYLFLLQGMNYAIPLVLIPYLMIKLGVESYGLIGFSTAIIQFLILFVDFGFNMGGTKRVAINKDDKKVLSHIFFSTVCAKVILLSLSLIVFLAVYHIPRFSEYQLALLCTLPILIGNTFTFTWFYQGIGQIRYLSILSMVCRILILPLTFYFVQTPEDYIYAISLNSMVYILVALISILWIIKNKLVVFENIKFSDILLELKESFPFFLSLASISLYTQLFVVVLGVFTNPAVVGIYTAAEKIIRTVSLLFYTPISQVYYPKIAYMTSIDRGVALKLIYRVANFTLILMIIISISLFIFSNFIESIIGKDYQGINILVQILCLVPFLSAVGGVAGQMGLIAYIDNTDAKKIFQNIYIVAGVFAVFQVSILTYFYKEIGTTFAVLLTELLVAILMIYYFIKFLKVKKKSKTPI